MGTHLALSVAVQRHHIAEVRADKLSSTKLLACGAAKLDRPVRHRRRVEVIVGDCARMPAFVPENRPVVERAAFRQRRHGEVGYPRIALPGERLEALLRHRREIENRVPARRVPAEPFDGVPGVDAIARDAVRVRRTFEVVYHLAHDGLHVVVCLPRSKGEVDLFVASVEVHAPLFVARHVVRISHAPVRRWIDGDVPDEVGARIHSAVLLGDAVEVRRIEHVATRPPFKVICPDGDKVERRGGMADRAVFPVSAKNRPPERIHILAVEAECRRFADQGDFRD